MRILAIDYGKVRVGLAVAHEKGGLPRPLQTLKLNTAFWNSLKRVVSEWEVSKVVVGLPILIEGEEGTMAREAKEFANRVGQETGLPVVLYDERFTTWEAKGVLRESGLSERRQKGKRDGVAAALLLERYLESEGA